MASSQNQRPNNKDAISISKMQNSASVEPVEVLPVVADSVDIESCVSPSYSLNDDRDEDSPLKSPSNQSSINQHQQMVVPRPERDFYRYPVKVPRSAYKYEVCEISRVRAAYDMQSESLTELPRGSVVSVEEIWSNRARISSPMCGWMSVYSSHGQQLLMPLDENAAKIGGYIMFQDEQQRIVYAEVIGYDHHCGLHSVMLKQTGLQWVSLKDPNLRYIPQTYSRRISESDQTKDAFLESVERYLINSSESE